MGLTNFPAGIASFGVPVLPPVGPTFTSGNVWFVCNATNKNGSNGNAGNRPDAPLATVDYAFGLCRANNGDIIYVMPGHAETVTATSIAHDVEGVSVIGLGHGFDRPTFTFGAAAATITISAANAVWTNMRFVANFADVAAAFTIGAAKYVKIHNNYFLDTSSILNFLSIVVTGSTSNAADGLEVTHNYYQGLAATANAFISILGTNKRVIITNNHVNKRATNDAGQFLTIAALVLTGAVITDNTLIVLGATGAAVGIFLTGSSTTNDGIVARNFVASLDTTAELIATAGTKFQFFENYYTGNYDASAKLWPVVDAA